MKGRTLFWIAATTYAVIYARFKWNEDREMLHRVMFGE